jgi:drug/metabolite transporter (DMT)-like permease
VRWPSWTETRRFASPILIPILKTKQNKNQDLAIFTATANASIISLNLSLMMNAVGFYQVAKLLIIPFVCGVERLWLGRRFSRQVTAAVAVVVVGVAIVYVGDFEGRGTPTVLRVLSCGRSVHPSIPRSFPSPQKYKNTKKHPHTAP